VRRRSFLAAVAAAASAVGVSGRLHTAAAATLPLKQRALLGINNEVHNGPPANPQLHALEHDFGMRFPWVGLFWSFNTDFSTQQGIVGDLAADGRGLHVCFQPKMPTGQTAPRMADVATGKWDKQIDAFIATARAYPGPVVVRFGHEMKGDWYTWSAGQPGCKTPAEWVSAWRHVVARERATAGVSNIRWYWCPNRTDSGAYRMEQYWPGLEWVDIAGCDGYNNNKNGAWKTFDVLFTTPYQRITALSGGRPFWIGEVGCVEPHAGQTVNGVQVSKAGWLRDMFASTALAGGQSLAVSYFNFPNDTAGDRRFTSSPATYSAAAALYKSAVNPNAFADGYGVLPP
jgi:mannan endo-1,4-beta-mannosidase